MEALWQDVRYGLRMLVKRPGFTAAAALSLALGIGANTAIFAVVDGFLWRPFPVEDPDRLVAVFTTDPKNPGFLPVSTLNYEDFRDRNQVLTGLACFGFANLDLTVGENTERIFGFMASSNYFEVLGVRFSRGRGFLPEEGKALGSEPVAVLSYAFWQKRFGGDPNLIGHAVTLNGAPYTVVGIAPERFNGTIPGFNPAVWIPYTMRNHANPASLWYTEGRRGLWLLTFGRLRPGVSLEEAQAGMRTLARQLEQQYPQANEGRGVALTTLAEARANPIGAAQNPIPLIAALLMAVVGLVLLIACSNIANLLLARAASRQKEIAVRLTLGASRPRLIRQLLTESVLLALLGGTAGVLVAVWATDLIAAFQPPGLGAFALDVGISLRVLGFTLLVALLTGFLFGLAPALHTSRPDIHENLKEGGRHGTERAGRTRLRNLLVMVEVALAVLTLIGAGLFARSLRNAMAIDPGFRAENVLTMNLDVSLQGYEPDRGREFYRQLRERMEALSGIQSVALASRLPLAFGFQRTVIVEGQVASEQERGVLVNVNSVDLGYFDTLGIPLLRGRAFQVFDDADAPRVAIINQTMANRFWPDQEALGKRFRFPTGIAGEFTPFIEVVGMAPDTKYVTLGEDPLPFIYLPFRQDYNPAMFLLLRTAADPAVMMATVRREIRSLDSRLPVFNVQPLTQQISNSLWLPRMGAYLLGIFGLVSLALAAVGIYGVISYSVSQRTHEIGIRMALGAQGQDIVKLVLRQGMVLVLLGMSVGLAAAFLATPVLRSLLYGMSATDPVIFTGISLLLAAIAALACYVPARRATRVDPMVALRYE